MTKQEKPSRRSYPQAKNANNKKAENIYNEHRERQTQAETSEDAMNVFTSQGNKILLRIARIAIGATVKWDRRFREIKDDESQAGQENNEGRSKVLYMSRLLACTICGSLQETRGKQLKVEVGFRAIHCKK